YRCRDAEDTETLRPQRLCGELFCNPPQRKVTAHDDSVGASRTCSSTASPVISTVPFRSSFPHPVRMPDTAVLIDFRTTAYMSWRYRKRCKKSQTSGRASSRSSL